MIQHTLRPRLVLRPRVRLAVLGVLAAGVLAALIWCRPIADSERELFPSPEGRTGFRLRRLVRILEEYRVVRGAYPSSLDSLMSIRPSLVNDSLALLYDAWGRRFIYSTDDRRLALRSLGPDGITGTADDHVATR